ncbi:MAG: ribosomal RNA small subunit methyltransferase A [Verrucomicrobia bacterium]|nr:ribosomal RNA small subunit methyltransferase A [Verrucomicrobiota bacterium]
MNLSEMRQILARGDIRLTKSLGQNFMHDGNQLRRMLRAAELAPGDRVLEIGPGLGALTELLLAAGCEVLAIEKDRRLSEFLGTRFPDAGKLRLVHADALELLRDMQEQPGPRGGAGEPAGPTGQRGLPDDWSDWKLVANLPYAVASPILVELAQGRTCPGRMVVTLQEEVALRLLARAGTAEYGVLTLLVGFQYVPGAWFRIPASCFFPAPDAGSACVTLTRRPTPLLDADLARAFARIVKRGFSQRRKMMLKLLKTDWPAVEVEAAFNRLELSGRTRAESVSLEQFAELTRALARSGEGSGTGGTQRLT